MEIYFFLRVVRLGDDCMECVCIKVGGLLSILDDLGEDIVSVLVVDDAFVEPMVAFVR